MAKLVDDFDERAMFSPQSTGPLADGNPLAAYYRVPGLHIILPTGGAFLPPGSIDLTMNGDIPVWPMRAADEMLLKSPDALMSGYAIEMLIKSCVPAIKLPRLISSPDLDVILLAIRAATYGDDMSLNVDCPKCQNQNEFNCHLPSLMATMKGVPPENTLRLSDEVVAYVRPYNVANATKIALASYEEARRLKGMEDQMQDNAMRAVEVNKSIDRLNRLNLEVLADCVIKVVVPGTEVTDRSAIMDFVANVPKPWVEKIDRKLKKINQLGIDKKLSVKCSNKECGHQWKTELEFDPSSFFDADFSE